MADEDVNSEQTTYLCSISVLTNSPCSAGATVDNLVFLKDCNKSVSSHLRSLNISYDEKYLTEGCLISSRIGVFNLNPFYTVCSHHWSSLGLNWKRKSSCILPTHKGKCKGDRPVSLRTSYALVSLGGALLPVGSAICKACKSQISRVIETFPDMSKIFLTAAHDDLDHVDAKNMVKQPASEEFGCPEGCNETFSSFSAMHDHCMRGDHLYVQQQPSTYDIVKLRWYDACFNLSENVTRLQTEESHTGDRVSQSEEPQGWSLKKDKKHVRFSEKVKVYLRSVFEDGEKSGSKMNATAVARNMRVVQENRVKLFNSTEYLDANQIASFFSRLSAEKKMPSKCSEDIESAVAMIEKFYSGLRCNVHFGLLFTFLDCAM